MPLVLVVPYGAHCHSSGLSWSESDRAEVNELSIWCLCEPNALNNHQYLCGSKHRSSHPLGCSGFRLRARARARVIIIMIKIIIIVIVISIKGTGDDDGLVARVRCK